MAISNDVLNSINGTGGTGGTSGTGSSGKNDSSAQAVQDRFLKLLVAQLNNQDPMNPLDNAQMTSQIAQLNTVTGIENLNATVTGMLSQLASMQTLQGVGMVGREVLVEGSRLAVDDGVGHGDFDLATAADSVKVEIRTAGGALVSSMDLGSMDAGRQSFSWDASGYTGGEALTFKVIPSANKLPVSATSYERARVQSVSSENNQLMLQLSGRDAVPYSSVKALL